MSRSPDRTEAIALGATLYLPGTRQHLAPIALGRRYKLRSAVICLEDSIRRDEAPAAMRNVAALLGALPGDGSRPMLFIRPRDPAMLEALLRLDGIERIDGFVLPKATADSLPDYLACPLHAHHRLMPTLETREMFDPAEVRRLRDQLLAVRPRVLALRIGGNDLLRLLGARRSSVRTLYEGPLAATVAGLAAAFAPHGFALSAPVFEHFAGDALLREEVERDIEHGLVTKTVIHPRQIAVVEAAYAVAREELAEAKAILAPDGPAVFALAGSMCEPATHRPWALTIVRRAEIFGIRREPETIAAVL
ncbi:MAG TPA: HpcH/HpaI aldolase/citrate lyase family protein [Allosphingosinicella sp.]|nr:HpcH/HpaI aldolase/citrate lyase family protein [Allosphingosinicella sp.]